MLRRVPPSEACGGITGFSPWGSTDPHTLKNIGLRAACQDES